MGGTGKIVSELKKLMIDNGIIIKTNTEAKEFVVEKNKITKIITNNDEISNIDLVVCNADPPVIYSKLLKKYNLSRPIKKKKKFTLFNGFVCSIFLVPKKKI